MNRFVFYPDNITSSNEFAYIIRECQLEATVVVSSDEIKKKFEGISGLEFVYLYKKKQLSKVGAQKKKRKYYPKLLLVPLQVLRFYKRYCFFSKSLSSKKITAIIATDRSYADGFVMPFYFFCKKKNIRMIIPSTANFADKESMLKARFAKDDSFKPTFIEKLLLTRFIERIMGVELIYYSIDIILTFFFFGVLSKNPWVMGANNNAILCLNNDTQAKKMIDHGVNKENIAITGSYKITQNFNNARERVEVVGFSLPQMFEHNILPWDEHINIIEAILFELTFLNVRVVVFLHPKMDRDNYKYLETKFNCHIASKRTDVGIMDVDLYISTFSTTVLTATIFGIPSLVIDCFDAKYTMYDEYSSISVFDDVPTLIALCRDIIANEECYQQLKAKTNSDSKLIEVNPGMGMINLKKLIQNDI